MAARPNSPASYLLCKKDGTVTDPLIDFYVERARGRVGLIYKGM